MQTPDLYVNAPTKIKVGRGLMVGGSILFFIVSLVTMIQFVAYLVPNTEFSVDWSNPMQVFDLISSPFLSIFYIFAGIGGICYVIDKHRIKVFASLAGVIMLVVILIATVLMFRNLIKSCLAPDANVAAAWITFLTDFLSIQITGGIYFIGWFLTKDYTGD